MESQLDILVLNKDVVMDECYICGAPDDVIHFKELYPLGSEGCNLCIECRVTITSLIRKMASAAGRRSLKAIKRMKKEG